MLRRRFDNGNDNIKFYVADDDDDRMILVVVVMMMMMMMMMMNNTIHKTTMAMILFNFVKMTC